MKVVRTAVAVIGTIASIAALIPGPHQPLATTVAAVAGAVSAALAVATMLMKRPLETGGSQTDFKADVDAGLPYWIGRTCGGGNIVHQDSFGNKRKYQAFVVVGSAAGPINAIESFKVDRVTVAFNGSGEAIGYYGNEGGNDVMMWLRTQLGASPEAAALSPFLGTLPGWDSTSKLSGFFAWLWQLRYDVKGKRNYNNGVPKPSVVGEGVKVYDPRLDSTYPGGSGSCRAGVESTYVYSENPWLHALTYAIGRFQNGKRILGIGMPTAGIDVAAYVEAANIADINDWKAGGIIYSTDDKWDRLKAMAQAGGGVPMRMAAQLSCMVNAPRVSLATITSADLVGEASIVTSQPRRDRINGIIPRYRSEAHDWEVVPAAVVRVPDLVTADGGERTREVSYPLVQDVDQAAELAAYDIMNARERGPISLQLKTKWMGYKPGDCLTVDVPELDLNDQPCVILRRQLDPSSAVVTLEMVTETASKHAFALGETGTAPPVPDTSTPDLSVPAPAPGSWAITAGSVTSGGVTVPALVIEGEVDNTNADFVIFEYRVFGATVWNPTSLEDATTTRKEILGVNPDTEYEVAVSYRVNGEVGERLVLSTVITAPPPYIPAGTTFTASDIANVPAGGIAGDTVQEAINELDAEKQPLDSDLTAIAALTTTTYGRSQLTLADAAADRAQLAVDYNATRGATLTLNGFFRDDVSFWSIGLPATTTRVAGISTDPLIAHLHATASDTVNYLGASGTLANRISCRGGETIYMRFKMRADITGTNRRVRATIRSFDAAGTSVLTETLDSIPIAAATWEDKEVVFTLPANAATFHVSFAPFLAVSAGYVDFGGIEVSRYSMNPGMRFTFAGVPTASQVMYDVAAASARLTSAVAKAGTAATAQTVFTVKNGASSIGTITFAAGATVGTLAITSSPTLYSRGDLLSITAPAAPDATLANVTIRLS